MKKYQRKNQWVPFCEDFVPVETTWSFCLLLNLVTCFKTGIVRVLQSLFMELVDFERFLIIKEMKFESQTKFKKFMIT